MSRIYISYKAHIDLIKALSSEGHELCLIRPQEAVSQPISAHPDIFLCKLGTSPKSPVFQGDASRLGLDYPNDVLYNAVVTEKLLVCNTKTVSQELVKAAKKLYPDIRTVHVAQGYTKCNMVVVDESHFITEDEGIYMACPENCLLVKAGKVELPGFDKGFIGGCSGRIGEEIWFNGDISAHPNYRRIKVFIESCGLGVQYIKGLPLVDIGSIIEEAL